MVARKSWPVQQVAGVGQNTVEDVRLAMSALWTPTGLITSRTGLVPTGAGSPGAVTATTPTPDGFVHVAPFRAAMQSSRGGGVYGLCIDEIADIDILGTEAADPANDRIDLIVWQQSDTYFSDADSDFEVRHIVGTPAAVPVDPAVDGSPDYILRARVTVPANATAIEQGDIAEEPLPWTVATGGILPVPDQAGRDAIVAPHEGMVIHRDDRNWLERRTGSAWQVEGVAVCSSTADRNSAITSPYEGQTAVTTDTDSLWLRAGGAWRLVGRVGDGEPQPYVPVWSVAGSPGTLGNGIILGEYVKVNRLVTAVVGLTMGTTTVPGSGSYSFTLPFPAQTFAFGIWPVFAGGGYVRDVSATAYHQITPIINADGLAIGGVYSPGNNVGSSVPMTFANLDVMVLCLSYWTAS